MSQCAKKPLNRLWYREKNRKKPTCPYKCYHREIHKRQRTVQPPLNKDAIYLCRTDHLGDFNISDFIYRA